MVTQVLMRCKKLLFCGSGKGVGKTTATTTTAAATAAAVEPSLGSNEKQR